MLNLNSPPNPQNKLDGSLRIGNIRKRYGSFNVVDGVSFTVHKGEFLTILGSSGSGKTTTLMMIAGFVYPTSGNVTLAGQDITYMPPHLRNIGMVFQNYALFPHLSISDNIAFPLKMRRLPKPEIRERVADALRLVKLEEHSGKLPSQLSGGQQQRIALARALVYEPSLLLMDEPLGALDRSLREHMQIEIKRIQAATGVTIVYVTHDQNEALAMSDRVIVMEKGCIAGEGDPQELYRHPRNDFVAKFVGETNLLKGHSLGPSGGGSVVSIAGHRVEVASGAAAAGSGVSISVRPESIRCSTSKQNGRNEFSAVVVASVYLGDVVKYLLDIAPLEPSQLPLQIVAKALAGDRPVMFSEGQTVYVSWAPEDCWVVVNEGARHVG